jgi:transcriptional regulator with XRE-family HTH domain
MFVKCKRWIYICKHIIDTAIMKERLQQLLNKEQLTPVRFAEMVGVQRSSVSHILSGRNNPSLDFIQKILMKFPHVSSDWLINGIGDIYREHSAPKQFKTAELFLQPSEDETVPHPTIPEPESGKTATAPVNETSKRQAIADTSLSSEIERIVVFYRNRTFLEYKPGED